MRRFSVRAAATNGITVGAWGCRRHAMKLCYKALSGTENPFFCPLCTATKQQKSILELQSSVWSLSDEVRELKALVATLQKKECTGSEPCLGEQTRGTVSVQWTTIGVVRRKCQVKNSNFNKDMGSGDRMEQAPW